MRSVEVVALFLCVGNIYGQDDIRKPPSIMKGPIPEAIFRSGERIILECQGEGVPEVEYEWKKNGFDMNLNLANIQRGAHGTIVITPATAADEGFYQCLATNQYGTALSIMAHLQMAVLESSSGTSVQTKTVKEGEPFHIQAVPPKSFPKPTYGWEIAHDAIDKNPSALSLSRRIQVADNGDLHFAYALPEDDLGGRIYKCSTYNSHLDFKAGGSHTNITVQRANVTRFAPTLSFSSEPQTVAVIGKSVSLRCFFSGNPEPTLTWKGPRNTLPTGRYRLDNFNSKLTISEIMTADQGDYVCMAQNTHGRNEHTLQLRVEAIPTFRSVTDGPFNVNITEGESVTFKCSACAIPEASIAWFQDGKPLDVNNPPRRFQFSDSKTSLTIRDVCRDCPDRNSSTTDLTVIQCNASNVHGYAFASGYLNVLKKTKVKRVSTEVMVNFNEKKFRFECSAASDPSTPPTVRWEKVNESQGLTNAVEIKNNILTIHVKRTDPNDPKSKPSNNYLGEYNCNATNRYSEDFWNVKLILDDVFQSEKETVLWLPILVVGFFLLPIGVFLGLRCSKTTKAPTHDLHLGNAIAPNEYLEPDYDMIGYETLPEHHNSGYETPDMLWSDQRRTTGYETIPEHRPRGYQETPNILQGDQRRTSGYETIPAHRPRGYQETPNILQGDQRRTTGYETIPEHSAFGYETPDVPERQHGHGETLRHDNFERALSIDNNPLLQDTRMPNINSITTAATNETINEQLDDEEKSGKPNEYCELFERTPPILAFLALNEDQQDQHEASPDLLFSLKKPFSDV